MKGTLLAVFLAVFTALGIAADAAAQEAPALQGASPDEKARILQLVEDAKKEGSLTYWDVVIQPETNDKLSAQFREYYGLPASFKVNYQLSSTANLVTRVEQEIGADRVTIDVAAIGSPTWVFGRVNKGDVLAYASPQYRHYASTFERGMGKDGFFAFNGAYLFVPMWDSERTTFNGQYYQLDEASFVPKPVNGHMPVLIGSAGKRMLRHIARYADLRPIVETAWGWHAKHPRGYGDKKRG